MTRRTSSPDLTPEAARYLEDMRSLRPPVDLVEHVMVEVEATPQKRLSLAGMPKPVLFAAGAAAVAAALLTVALLRQAPPSVGPQTSPVPGTSEHSWLDQLPSAGEVVNRTPVGFDQVAKLFAHGYLWLEDTDSDQGTASGELVRVDPATGAFDVLDVTGRVGNELNATADETSVWARDDVTETRTGVETAIDELVEIDPETLREVQRIRMSSQVGDYAVGGGVVWFIDALTDELVRLDLASGAETVRVSVPSPQAVLIDGNRLWVGRADGAMSRLDAVTGAVHDNIVTQVVAFSMSEAGNQILIYGGMSGLVTIGKQTGAIITLVNQHEPGDDIPAEDTRAPTSADGRIWATTLASGHLVELDPVSLQPIAALQLGLTSFQGMVVAGGDALWVVGTDSAGDPFLVEVAPTP